MSLPIENPGRIRIGGIKLSRELVQFRCVDSVNEGTLAARFFRQLADLRINTPFVSVGRSSEGNVTSCCIEAEDNVSVMDFLERKSWSGGRIERIAPVGTVTLFPHQSRLLLLGRLMTGLDKASIPVYAMASSISALTFSTDFGLLNRAVGVVESVAELPSNHSPLHAEFRIRQVAEDSRSI